MARSAGGLKWWCVDPDHQATTGRGFQLEGKRRTGARKPDPSWQLPESKKGHAIAKQCNTCYSRRLRAAIDQELDSPTDAETKEEEDASFTTTATSPTLTPIVTLTPSSTSAPTTVATDTANVAASVPSLAEATTPSTLSSANAPAPVRTTISTFTAAPTTSSSSTAIATATSFPPTTISAAPLAASSFPPETSFYPPPVPSALSRMDFLPFSLSSSVPLLSTAPSYLPSHISPSLSSSASSSASPSASPPLLASSLFSLPATIASSTLPRFPAPFVQPTVHWPKYMHTREDPLSYFRTNFMTPHMKFLLSTNGTAAEKLVVVDMVVAGVMAVVRLEAASIEQKVGVGHRQVG